MGKKYIIILILGVLIQLSASGQHAWKIDREAYSRLPRTNKLRCDVEFLSDTLLGGIGRGTSGHTQAGYFIINEFKLAGLIPLGKYYVKSFSLGNGEYGHNVVGMLEGSWAAKKRKYIIVGSHYDGHGKISGEVYPGADSNVSGIAGLMEIARTFRRQRNAQCVYDSNIIFVAFDAYMDGREGSKKFWNDIVCERLRDPVSGQIIRKSDISLMIDLDQIGSTISPVEPRMNDYFIAIGEDSLPPCWKGLLERCNWFYYINLDLAFTYYNSKRFTDVFYRLGDRLHFIEGGVPTMYFTSGITPYTNKVGDTPEKLNYSVLQRRCTLVFRFIEKCL